jgi:hypothetical protein
MNSVRFDKIAGGIFVVHYATEDDLLPDRQKGLIAALRAEQNATAIVFVLAPDVWKVDLSVPKFWAEIVSDPALPLRAIAVVSTSVAVRAATHTFRVMTMLRRQNLGVASLHDEPGAVDWAREQIGLRRVGS